VVCHFGPLESVYNANEFFYFLKEATPSVIVGETREERSPLTYFEKFFLGTLSAT